MNDAQPALPDDRVAHNEVAARRINEAIEDGRSTLDGVTGFVCECGQLGCSAVLEVTLAEYEQVRADPRQFLVVLGHEAGFDAVVSNRERYAVVEKQGFAGRLAESTDPRGDE
jgi:hypothetical protein